MSDLSNQNFLTTRLHATTLVAALLISVVGTVQAEDLRVMKTGLGEGSIAGPGITCGTDCNESYVATTPVMLSISSVSPGSEFTSWGGDCPPVVVVPPATPDCTVPMDEMRSVRANFDLITSIPPLTAAELTPVGIAAYLAVGGPGENVNTPAEFVAALPVDFKENWILMPRSESLQTGTAESPRILLISEDGTKAFTLGLEEHSSYPGSHPNAIEYMQWDARPGPNQNNFRFHEIIVDTVPDLDEIGAGSGMFRFPERATRGITEDDAKCFACHSTRNVKHTTGSEGTTGFSPGSVKFKNKPNWDSYDSWGGMLGFNRDRIYKGSVEAAAFRRLLNLWTWQDDDAARRVIEQLELQPAGVRTKDIITRWDTPTTEGGENDGYIHFPFFDPAYPMVVKEPLPAGSGPDVNYSFDRKAGAGTGTEVIRNPEFITLQHSVRLGDDRFDPDEGRGTNFFNKLYLGLNPGRIADEMIPLPPATDYFATGSVPIDVRPIALAIANGCITKSETGAGLIGDIDNVQSVGGLTPPLAAKLPFFEARNGLNFDEVYDDTRRRAQSMPRRKADIEKLTLDRDGDVYVSTSAGADPADGLFQLYGDDTDGIVADIPGESAADKRMRQFRQEVYRRTIDVGHPDETVMGRIYVDREDDSTDGKGDNTTPVALYRFFLEPLGVSVDKWSMGVRGRSRTYSFADQFNLPASYTGTFNRVFRASLGLPAGGPDATICPTVLSLVETQFLRLPGAGDPPTYTDIQRILNKSCIECHGGLDYPPARGRISATFDFSENPAPPTGERRLWRSLRTMRSLTGAGSCDPSTPVCAMGSASDVSGSFLFQMITDRGRLEHPYNPAEPYAGNPDAPGDPDVADERCPEGLMPCGGPPLSKVDIETFGRWIIGGRPNTEGDPHIRTVDGTHYDFQSAGEFVLLRGEAMELQARQTAVTTAGPLGPDSHTGLRSCVSVNTAVAMRVGEHQISYQPDIKGHSDNEQRRLILRVDGKPVLLNDEEFTLAKGGRIVRTSADEGIEVYFPGGTSVAITPGWWAPHQIWYMHINVNHGRAVNGVMGAIAPGNWLPALSNGDFLGPRPTSLAERHQDLYETFADSWRVDATTSLFHYESGLSPQSFVVNDWPVSEPLSCPAPPQPGGPASALPAPTPIAEAQAVQLCSAITDPNRRDNCVQDVVATGEPGFAETYLQTQSLEQRLIVAPPLLVSPADNAFLPADLVDFEWSLVPGTEDIDLIYRHCLWNSDELYDLNNCTKLSEGGSPLIDLIPPALLKHLSPTVCFALLLLLLVIAVVLVIRSRYKTLFVVLVLALILVVICLLHNRQQPDQQLKTSVSDLEAGKIYYWRVVAETKDGIAIESQINQFEVEN